MEFLKRAAGLPAHLGILPGTFNPPTRAHLALAEAGLADLDEVVLVLPGTFPHKSYGGPHPAERARMILLSLRSHARLSAATSEGGLFVEIARECRTAYGDRTRLSFLCGRDAAERIIGWNYGSARAIERMLEEFELVVADRQGAYVPPVRLAGRVRGIRLAGEFDEVSASTVRDRIRQGLPWEDLVPSAIVPLVRDIYSATA